MVKTAEPTAQEVEGPVGAAGADREQPAVRTEGLRKTFRRADGTLVRALDDVSIEVEPGEFLVLLGPSGCGKSTLLRCIAGLEAPDEGSVSIGGREVFSSARRLDESPDRRRLGMVFQSYALWPHMTAAANIAFPLKCRKWRRDAIERRVKEVLEIVGIPTLGGQHPGQMSGGQQQRVALARAIAADNSLILFDEPLSNVDAKVRLQLRLELLSMQRELGFAAVYVTHDQTEAMELATRIAVMDQGRIMQLGAPREIYQRPTGRYVADFIGTSNELVGEVTGLAGDDQVEVRTALGDAVASCVSGAHAAGDPVTLVWRPERCTFTPSSPGGPNSWEATVRASLFVGSHTEHVLDIGESTFRLWRADDVVLEPGSRGWLSVEPADLLALPEDPSPA